MVSTPKHSSRCPLHLSVSPALCTGSRTSQASVRGRRKTLSSSPSSSTTFLLSLFDDDVDQPIRSRAHTNKMFSSFLVLKVLSLLLSQKKAVLAAAAAWNAPYRSIDRSINATSLSKRHTKTRLWMENFKCGMQFLLLRYLF